MIDVAQALLGRRTRFLSVELRTAPGVLVPRPETELLGSAAVEVLRTVVDHPPLFVDVCCGSGNLACAIAAAIPAARGWATDLTTAAVDLARRNVEDLGIDSRVQVLQGDLLAPLVGLCSDGTLDAIVCNPPYISTGRLARDRAGLLEHEPREAFDGGPYGLTIHGRIAREAAALLRPGAPLLVEVGEGQERQVVLLLKRAGSWEEPQLHFDGGSPRVVVARRKAG
jgi:release factor glutamine methyltransferase